MSAKAKDQDVSEEDRQRLIDLKYELKELQAPAKQKRIDLEYDREQAKKK